MTHAESPRPGFQTLFSGKNIRTARLASGLVMFTFVTMHLLNHAMLLVSIEAANAVRPFFLLIWRNPLSTLLLYGALATHLVLVLYSIYRRRTLIMPAREAIQTIFGLAIPLLIAEHAIGTRLIHVVSGIEDDYAYVLRVLWVAAPMLGLRQAFAIVIIWTHGCLGLYFWVRFRNWYPQAAPYLLATAILVPVLALLGFAAGGRALATYQTDPILIDRDLFARALTIKETALSAVQGGFLVALLGVLALRRLRIKREQRDIVEIRYSTGQTARVAGGYSVLEASRVSGIPHYSVCGGRGRCSTCRIKVSEGLADQPEPGSIERATLARIGADRDVRLACQLRPTHNLSVTPLLKPDRARRLALAATPGREHEVAVLFCDIRNFTGLADHRLPFDIVFLLNRYFAMVGAAVEEAGGRMDKFIGDGAMALFGVDTDNRLACRQALQAASAILEDLDRLNRELAGELSEPLRIAIGIHAGPAIVGAMGYGEVMPVTAIGDTVNTASRLELVAKEFNAALVVSEPTAILSGLDLSGFELRKIDIRGRAEPLHVHVIPAGKNLSLPRTRKNTDA
ncbi:adenylate/guanylate cyclase domain-containing protein [Mesorhizobium sp. NBSH29]|uniref:adenylate/guanylate cyclase domain-containing protein n=1 Tax=Mesorhizobium sp. NBSH29 TaxID=2654249 RepID=UPI002156121D|nr:adenylate/guanylate cyclase domain-containing protein [Mesorhizobium sp. NBSH29]